MYENVKSKMLHHSAIGYPTHIQSRLLGEMMMIMVIMLILVVIEILVIIVMMMIVVMLILVVMEILVIIVMMMVVMMAMIKDTLHTQSRPTGARGERHPHGRCNSRWIINEDISDKDNDNNDNGDNIDGDFVGDNLIFVNYS